MLLTLLSVCSKLFTVCVRRFLKYIAAIARIADSKYIITFDKLFDLHYSVNQPTGLTMEFCCR